MHYSQGSEPESATETFSCLPQYGPKGRQKNRQNVILKQKHAPENLTGRHEDKFDLFTTEFYPYKYLEKGMLTRANFVFNYTKKSGKPLRTYQRSCDLRRQLAMTGKDGRFCLLFEQAGHQKVLRAEMLSFDVKGTLVTLTKYYRLYLSIYSFQTKHSDRCYRWWFLQGTDTVILLT